MTESEAVLNMPAEIRLKRYLHTGLEIPKYYPGNWNAQNYFTPEKAKAVQEFINDSEKCLDAVKIVEKTYADGSYTRIEPLLFTLVMCLRNGSELLRETVYQLIPTLCKKQEHLFLFTKYCKELGDIGTGCGWRSCIKKWYHERPILQLTKDVSLYMGHHGIRHGDLIKMSHLKPGDDVVRRCVYDFILNEYKSAQSNYGTKKECSEVLNLFKKVKDIRLCEDPNGAADLIREQGFTLCHVPGHLLCKKEVWEALIPNLGTAELLQNIQRIHNIGLLEENSSTEKILKDALAAQWISSPPSSSANTSSQTSCLDQRSSQVHPLLIYITIKNYEKMGRPMTYDKAKILQNKENKRRNHVLIAKMDDVHKNQKKMAENAIRKNCGKSHKPNPAIIEALYQLIEQSWLDSTPTEARYLITIDMRDEMFKGRQFCERIPCKSKRQMKRAATAGPKPPEPNKTSNRHIHPFNECFYNRNVSPGYAAIILTLQIWHREKNVMVAVFTDDGIQCVMLSKTDNIEKAEAKLRGAKVGKVRFDRPIEWACQKNKEIDVFINIVDRISRSVQQTPGAKRRKRTARTDTESMSTKQRHGNQGEVIASSSAQDPVGDFAKVIDPIKSLEEYREKMKLPGAKLVTIALSRHNGSVTDGTHTGVLDVVGIDEHTPKVIDAFCRNHFQ